jgi:hypothetical protein
MGPEILVAIIVPLAFFALVFGIFYIRNKENMALIERGINPRKDRATPQPFISLKYGLMLCGVGTGLFLAFLTDEFLVNHKAVTPGGEMYNRDFPQIYFAMIAIFGGLGLMLSYMVEKKHWLDKDKEN